ncbi:hypothetical protein A2635_00660 [Candidatus Peribacteria bacterium RIFCSPHIGHO2_01_FULL_51_9]|nr:MAG: hypothetical protein A2635_00660 [Candidatus Peribacteria bacterium RIFCSPHIGHO2_01_FULL_51_9]
MTYSTQLFHTDGTPCTPLRDLLEYTGIEHDGTITSIRDQTQIWYQKGKFPYEIRDPDKSPLWRAELLPRLSELGLSQEIHAQIPNYRYCLLLGATVKAVRRRLAFLSIEWNGQPSVRFPFLFLLGNERPISPDEYKEFLRYDNKELPFDRQKIRTDHSPRKEWEMMLTVYAQGAAFPWDASRGTSTFFVPTQGERANTADTIAAWLRQKNPEPDSCLVVSSQPHVGYQEWVVRNALPEGFTVEAIGPAAGESTPVAGYLNALTKWIFEEAKARGV